MTQHVATPSPGGLRPGGGALFQVPPALAAFSPGGSRGERAELRAGGPDLHLPPRQHQVRVRPRAAAGRSFPVGAPRLVRARKWVARRLLGGSCRKWRAADRSTEVRHRSGGEGPLLGGDEGCPFGPIGSWCCEWLSGGGACSGPLRRGSRKEALGPIGLLGAVS